MTLSFPSSTPMEIRHAGLCFLLAPPEIRLSNGEVLESDLSCPPAISEDQGVVAVRYRWVDSRGRYFAGKGRLSQLGRGHTWDLEVAPEDGLAWSLESTTEGSGVLSGWSRASELQLFHADNVRGATQGVFLMEGGYWVGIGDWRQPLNMGRWQSFPGLWLVDRGRNVGFVCGVLSQGAWKHSLLGTVADGDAVELRGRFFPPGISARSFADGEAYVGETLYFEITEERLPARAFAAYLEVLSTRLRPSKTVSYLRDRAFWDSWNDRRPHFWDVSMDLLRRTTGTLQRHFPAVTSLEVDDGYAFAGFQNVQADIWTRLEHGLAPTEEARDFKKVRRLGVAFAYEDDYATARDRFPEGVGAAAAEMKAAGFLPAIWLGMNIVRDARLVVEKPEWTIECLPREGDDPELARIFSGASDSRLQVLDPSLPEVREYYGKVFEILFREWGYEALKLDFWTYAFENDSFRLQRDDRTALELRRWLFTSIREHLPERSYLIACCDISTGNPFFCEWVDTIRYGIDIGNGKWESIRYSTLTGTFLLHVEAWRFYLLNPDSVGLLKALPESEKRCFLAWCAVTRSLCEMAGDLAKNTPDELRILKKLLLAPKNGEGVIFGEYEHLDKNEPAAVLFTPGDLFSRAASPALLPDGVLAVFNWSDETRRIEVDLDKLGLPAADSYAEVGFFEGDAQSHDSRRWNVELPPRSVRMSHISAMQAGVPRVLDSHWCVRSLRAEGDFLEMELLGDSEFGFQLSWPFAQPPCIESSTIPCEVRPSGKATFHIFCEPQDGPREWNLRLRPTLKAQPGPLAPAHS
jgi:hypothetical protein